jgi:hypothetical protein
VSQDRSTTPSSEQACVNTDREIWRERDGDYYADSIHVTEGGGIGINCGGYVIVKPIREWFRLAAAKETLPTPLSETGRSLKDATLAELEQANSPEPFKAEDEYAPAYVTGPNGFRFQCYNAVEMARKLNVLFASSATPAMKEPSEAVLEAADDFLSQGTYLTHPNVRAYLGTENGDDPEAWHSDWRKEFCRVILAAADSADDKRSATPAKCQRCDYPNCFCKDAPPSTGSHKQ